VQNRPLGHPRPSCGQKDCAEVAEEFYWHLQERQLFDKVHVVVRGAEQGPYGVGMRPPVDRNRPDRCFSNLSPRRGSDPHFQWGPSSASRGDTTSCLGPCSEGPSVLVYPEGVMYGGVKKVDVATIYEEHLQHGKPVESLLVSKEFWG
jgi:(2Fe-2S) ferredoxin